MNKTKIEWTDRTWNPVTGCTKVSQGCKNCYAERLYERFNGHGSFENVLTHPERLHLPYKWKKPQKVFVNSMSDLFHDHVPFEFIHQVFKVIVENPHLTFQILTKRPERMKRYFDSSFPNAFKRTADNPIPHNAWLGVSVENQATANERIPLLVQIPAAVRFLSCEPLLGPVDLYGLNIFHFQGLADYIENGPKPNCAIHWVIVGGESGPRARPMASIWASSLKNQCVSMLIPFFFKQWGEWSPVCSDDFAAPEKYVWVNEFTGENSPTGAKYVASRRVDHPHELMIRIGKKAAGRLLEGKEWNGYPTESNELPIEDVYDDLPF